MWFAETSYKSLHIIYFLKKKDVSKPHLMLNKTVSHFLAMFFY